MLRVFDVTAPASPQTIARRMPADDPEKRGMNPPGGGIAAVKLADGDYLFVVTTPGGTADGPRYHRFYRLSGDLSGPDLRAAFMGEQRLDGPGGFLFSENLSLVAECGTGRIFAVHTGTRRALSTRGYWRLSVLDEESGHPVLVPVALFEQPQNLRNCHLKSAATAWVSPAGTIEFYCHEYINNPDRDRWTPGTSGGFSNPGKERGNEQFNDINSCADGAGRDADAGNGRLRRRGRHRGGRQRCRHGQRQRRGQ